MRKFFLLALLLVGLAGCATAPAPYGNFVQNSAQTNDKKVVDDVVKKLAALYPPASTRFDLQHVTPDFFGTYLVESMRAKGYAVMEFKPEPKTASAASSASEPAAAAATPGLSLSYIVDQAKGSDLYRVTLVINRQQSLDRVYQVAQDGVIYPAGYWVRKE
ncbi:MAG: conjugal transfer protein TrbH [Planctomycetes bacterium]|nr:conjugal transfer protein TrbH [Planctomycetota bacterium]